MPDIWMDYGANLTKVPVNILPLVDDTDFKTIEASIAYNAAGMALQWNVVTPAGVIFAMDVTPTLSGANKWENLGEGMYGLNIPVSGGDINTDTKGTHWFSGVCTGVLPWRGPTIGFRDASLNNLIIENAYDLHRGLAGTALPQAAAGNASGLALKAASGDFLNVANLPQVAAGGANGLLRSGTNTGTTTLAALTVTGATSVIGGIVGGITGNITGNITGSVGSVGPAGINAAAFHADVAALMLAYLTDDDTKLDASALNLIAATTIPQMVAGITFGTLDETAFTATATEFESDDVTSAVADNFIGRIIVFTSGALAGQACTITDYALATGRGHFTVSALTAAPANDVTFTIF